MLQTWEIPERSTGPERTVWFMFLGLLSPSVLYYAFRRMQESESPSLADSSLNGFFSLSPSDQH